MSELMQTRARSSGRMLSVIDGAAKLERPGARTAAVSEPVEVHARLLAKVVASLADHLSASQPGAVYRAMVALLERALFGHALAATGGNQLRAARLLGLNRNTLRKRCRELGVLPMPQSLPRGVPTE